MEKWKKILFDEDTVKELAAIFGCTVHTVRNALNGKYESELTRRIRYRAIKLGLREKGEEVVTMLN